MNAINNKHMKRIVFTSIVVSFLTVIQGFCQKTDLFECIKMAEQNSPVLNSKNSLQSISDLKIENLRKNYLPVLTVNGQATYQSDVINIEIEMPEIPGIGKLSSPEIPAPSKDQYKISLDLHQIIWDGGATSSAKKIEEANLLAEQKQIDVDLYKLRQKVSDVFFIAVSLKKNEELLAMKQTELSDRIRAVRSAVENGVAIPADLNTLNVELLKVKQMGAEIEYGIRSACEMLSEITGMEINTNTELVLTTIKDEVGGEIQRPENQIIDLNKERLLCYSDLISKKRNPVLIGFGQFGYGKPGLNMLSDKFDTYYIVGARLSWNLWDWKKSKNERQILVHQSEMLSNTKDGFEKGLHTAMVRFRNDIEKYKKLEAMDNSIIELREKITKSSASNLENGTITTNDYINALNNEIQAKIDLENHRIKKYQATINLMTQTGSINERIK